MTLTALILTFLTLLLTGIMAGIYFTWTNAVMAGLDRLKPAESIVAFRALDAAILNKVFMTFFVLPTITALVSAVLWLLDGQTGAAVALFVATGVYLSGQVSTATVNVPMNKVLGEVDIPDDPAAATKLWTEFSGKWKRWNTFRSLVSLAGLALTGLALHLV